MWAPRLEFLWDDFMPFVATYGLRKVYELPSTKWCVVLGCERKKKRYVCHALKGNTVYRQFYEIICTTNNTDFSRQLSNWKANISLCFIITIHYRGVFEQEIIDLSVVWILGGKNLETD